MLVENLSDRGRAITLDVEASESIDTVMAKIEETKKIQQPGSGFTFKDSALILTKAAAC